MLALGCTAPERPDPHNNDAVAAQPAQPEAARAAANGWGDAIAWREFEDAFEIAKRERKPMMMVVWTSWCSKCKALKPSFHAKAFTELSEEFVMVNADQELVPRAMGYAPDGEYIPRILFFNPDGELDESFRNTHNPRFAYYYSPADDLLGRMRSVLETHGRAG